MAESRAQPPFQDALPQLEVLMRATDPGLRGGGDGDQDCTLVGE